MGIASLGLDAVAPCTGGLLYPVAFLLPFMAFGLWLAYQCWTTTGMTG